MSSLIHLAINGARMETCICLMQRLCLSSFSHCLLRGVPPCMTNLLLWTSFFFFNQNATLIPNFLCQVTNNFSSLQSHFYLLSALLKSHSISMVFHSLSNLWISYSHEAICHIFSFLTFLFKSKPSSAFI